MNKLALLTLLFVPWHPALAQTSSGGGVAPMEQISSSEQPAMPQITSSSIETKRRPPQLSTTSESAVPAAQLATERRTASSGRQLSNEPRSARASPALSSRSQGRDTAVERVEGEDRCDPAELDRKGARNCADVIETRAAEFKQSGPIPLSPEQRLLIDQQPRPGTLNTNIVAERLAVTGQAHHSLEALGIASIALQGVGVPEKEETKDGAGASEAAAAVVNAITNTGSPPQ